MAAVEASRHIRGDGITAESEWRGWLSTNRPRSVALDDLLSPAQRLVVVSPHPDDEVLACGGLIAMHAARGGRVAIVAVTDGEASHRGDPSWRATRLAVVRRMERERGLARLGLNAEVVTRLSLPDGDVSARHAALVDALGDLLRPTDCVVATWRLDGHPDHDAAGDAAQQACAPLGCRLIEAPVWMWHWSRPADPRVPWARMVAMPLAPPVSARKAAALAEHRTQLGPRAGQAAVLGTAILKRAARTDEYFFL